MPFNDLQQGGRETENQHSDTRRNNARALSTSALFSCFLMMRILVISTCSCYKVYTKNFLSVYSVCGVKSYAVRACACVTRDRRPSVCLPGAVAQGYGVHSARRLRQQQSFRCNTTCQDAVVDAVGDRTVPRPRFVAGLATLRPP